MQGLRTDRQTIAIYTQRRNAYWCNCQPQEYGSHITIWASTV